MQEIKPLYKPIDAIKEYSISKNIKNSKRIKSGIDYNFVYDRKYGIFYDTEDNMCHAHIMSILLIFHLFGDKIETDMDFDLYRTHKIFDDIDYDDLGDLYLYYFKGTAYKSSMDYMVQVYAPESLTIAETKLFGDFNNIEYLHTNFNGEMSKLITKKASPELLTLLEGKSNE